MEIGFIGLGIMGSRQAANLARQGHQLTVYNRTRATAEAWVAEHGGSFADSPREVAAHADVVFTMVVDGAQVADVLLRESDGAVHGARPSALFVDMTTIAPTESRAIGARLAEHGIAFVDAPVTGSAPKAADGTLTIMAGGAVADVERARPLLDAMGSLVLHAGELGQGEMVKLINNSVAATNAVALSQAITLARRTGVEPDLLRQVLSAGSGDSRMVTLKAEPMIEHDFAPLFKLEHMLKDVRLCLEEGQAAGAPFPAAAAAREAFTAAMGRDLGQADFAAVVLVAEAMAGLGQ